MGPAYARRMIACSVSKLCAHTHRVVAEEKCIYILDSLAYLFSEGAAKKKLNGNE